MFREKKCLIKSSFDLSCYHFRTCNKFMGHISKTIKILLNYILGNL